MLPSVAVPPGTARLGGLCTGSSWGPALPVSLPRSPSARRACRQTQRVQLWSGGRVFAAQRRASRVHRAQPCPTEARAHTRAHPYTLRPGASPPSQARGEPGPAQAMPCGDKHGSKPRAFLRAASSGSDRDCIQPFRNSHRKPRSRNTAEIRSVLILSKKQCWETLQNHTAAVTRCVLCLWGLALLFKLFNAPKNYYFPTFFFKQQTKNQPKTSFWI